MNLSKTKMKTLQLKAVLLGVISIIAFNGQSQNLRGQINSYLSEEMTDLGLLKTDIKDWVKQLIDNMGDKI